MRRQPRLHRCKIRPADERHVGAGYDDPILPRQADDSAGLVIQLAHAALLQIARVGLRGQNAPHRCLAPQRRGRGVRLASTDRAVGGRRRHALRVEGLGDPARAVSLQVQCKYLPHDLRGGFVREQTAVILRIFPVAVERKARNVAPAAPLVVQHSPHIPGQILQIPLIDKSVDLACLFACRVAGIHMVQHRDEPHAPFREQPVQIFFYQLHVTGEPRLRFCQNDLKFARPRVGQHRVEAGPRTVNAGVVLVGVYPINAVAVLRSPGQQQRPLVADALGLARGLFLVLLAQAAVDRSPALTRGHRCRRPLGRLSAAAVVKGVQGFAAAPPRFPTGKTR